MTGKRIREFNEGLLEGELFKSVLDNPQYLVSNRGRVYSMKTSRFLKPGINRGGYFILNLSSPSTYGKSHRVHRLVAELFLTNPTIDKPDVNHIDGNKQNNNIENLEWSNKSLNGKHAYKLGLNNSNNTPRLEDHPMAIINNKIAKEIKLLLSLNVPRKNIAKRFNIKVNIVHQIATNRTWKNVELT